MKHSYFLVPILLFALQIKAQEGGSHSDHGRANAHEVCQDDDLLLRVGSNSYTLTQDFLDALPEDCPLRVMFQCGLEPARKDEDGHYLIQEDAELFDIMVNWVLTGMLQVSDLDQLEALRVLADKCVPSMLPAIDRHLCLQTKEYEIEARQLDSDSGCHFICRKSDGLVIGLEDNASCSYKMMQGALNTYRKDYIGQMRNFILMAIPCGHHYSYTHEVGKCMSKIYNLSSRKPIGDSCLFDQAVCQINNAVPPYIPAPVGEQFGVFNMVSGKRVSEKLFKDPTSCLQYIYEHLLKDLKICD